MNHGPTIRRTVFRPSRLPSLGLAALLAALLCLAVGLAAAQDGSQGLLVTRTVEPTGGELGEVEFNVDLTLTGQPGLCPGITVNRPLDIVLVLDHSGSMDDDAGNGQPKLQVLQAATLGFLRQVDLTTDQVAVVIFDDATNLAQGLTGDATLLTSAINNITSGGGTNIEGGVQRGFREFELNGRSNAGRVLIVFSDGLHDGDPDGPIERAEDARAAGIRVITIGLGRVSANEIDPDLLTAMASGPGDVHLIENAAELGQVYQDIAQSVVSEAPPATDIVYTHQFDATQFELVSGSVRPETGVVTANSITWPVPQVLESPVHLTYQVRPRAGGAGNISLGDVVTYNLCGQTPQRQELPPALAVAVQVPPPTPSMTPTATLTPTVTPTITPTPRATWTPTPTPTSGERVTAAMNNLRCDTTWLNWLFLLLLLALLLYWLWRVWRARNELGAGYGRRGCLCALCRLLPWLFIPLTLLLLWLILSRLDLCPINESLYFWRIGGGSSNGEIWVTDATGRRPAEQFRTSGVGCVGCHAVSSNSRRLAAISVSGVGPVVVYGLDGQALEIPNVEASYVNFAPDGRQLAIGDANGDIQILDVDSGRLTPLLGASEPSLFETMPAWSADGQTIAFVRGASSTNNFNVTSGAEIYVVPATGGSAAPLPGASGDGFSYYPAYSPDGRWLAFTHHTAGDTTYAAPEAEIYLVPAAGGAPLRLAANDGPNGPLTNVSNSWPTWSLDGTLLAFNSKRDDPSYDLFMTQIDANGASGAAQAVPGASEPGVFEHLPFWGLQPEADPLAAILGLWPILLLYLLLALLIWLCRRYVRCDEQVFLAGEPPAIPPEPLPPLQLEALWQVAPTLIIGVGGTGRWVLTHLKKTLRDGGFGRLPAKVRFALIDTSEQEKVNVYRDALGNLAGVTFAGESLKADEVRLLGANVRELIGQTADAALAGWFPHDAYSGLSETEKDLKHGTQGRRPLARAGLIAMLRQATPNTLPADASALWAYLTEQSAAVRDDDSNLVRIVIVGGASGGMSGVLADVTYLARRAAESVLPPDGTVHVEGYLTTNAPFRPFVANPLPGQINTAATSRELQRFQLVGGRPYTMSYLSAETPPEGAASEEQASPSAAHLQRTYDRKLFDELVFFGGDAYPEYGEEKSVEPWATTLASMADVLALRLDRATAAGTNADHRAGTRRDAETLQTSRQDAIVSSAGSFTLRLPLVDMLHVVHARWALKLYHLFLMGDQDGREVSFKPDDAGLPQSPTETAREFVSGRRAGAPEGMSAAGALATGSVLSAQQVGQLAAQEDNAAFEAYLRDELGLILNGRRDDPRLQRRAPQLGYAIQFGEEVARLLGAAATAAEQAAGTAPETNGTSFLARLRAWLDMGPPSGGALRAAAARLAAWRDLAQRSHQSLTQVKRLLTDDERNAEGQTVVPGLYAELNRRQTEAEARRRQMDQVAVRRYLWTRPASPDRDPADPANQVDLIDEWYAAAAKSLGRYLDRFFWQVDADGAVRLSVVTYQGARPIRLDDRRRETIVELADALIALAADVTRNTAATVRLAQVLPTQLSTRQSRPHVALAERAWRVAQPSLRGAFAPGTVLPDYRDTAAVGIPENVQREDGLRELATVFKELDRRLDSHLRATPATVIPATDATALTLVRSYDLMPLWNVPELAEAWRAYARNAGSAPVRLAESPALATVFAAERAALEYERRLEAKDLLDQDFRQLHPLIVFALQRPAIVEAYSLALAAGWLTVRDGAAILRLPGDPAESVLRYEARRDLPPLVGGLLHAVQTWDSAAPLLAKLSAAVIPDAATQEAWRGFITRMGPAVGPITPPPPAVYRCPNGHELPSGKRFCPKCGEPAPEGNYTTAAPPPPATPQGRPFEGEPQAVHDLAAVAALAAYRRLYGAAAWDRLVMPAARWA